MSAYPLFLIPLLPLLGAAFSLLVGRRAGKNVVTLVTIGAVGGAALVATRAVWLLGTQLPASGYLSDSFFSAPWMKAGDLTVSAGLMMDRLSAVLSLVVTWIAMLIHIYASAYMEHDEGYTRFFAYLNLFTGAMLILVLGDSLPVTFVGWEGVGLCSYLLIGFWHDKEANAYAGRKAFVANRVGDLGFLLGMFLLFSVTGSLKYGDIAGHVDQLHKAMWFGVPAAYFIALCLLLGATGKSAQIPLYVWLPDAMAGPTPVSALIHAATMVTAGVYVVARMHVVFEVAPAALGLVAAIGAATALFAATIGIAQRDLKKVLAYSTISQLGFMFVGVASYVDDTSNYHGGIFHLVTHAFFKACLFLGAGSVMHALHHEGDIMRMGGLKKYLPHTRWTFLLACLAIAGFPGLGGFWSKDAILAGAHAANAWPMSPEALRYVASGQGGLAAATEAWLATHGGYVLYGVLLLAAFCTAFYMFRLYFLVFEGEFRGTEEQRHHIHESPAAMTGVLWVLAIGAIVTGLLGVPDALVHGGDRFAAWLSPVLAPQHREEDLHHFIVMASIASATGLLGIGLAWLLYGHGVSARVRNFVASFPRLYRTVANKYYVDEAYTVLFIRPVKWLAFLLWKAVDTFVIDMVLVNGSAILVGGIGKVVRYVHNGDVQRYVVAVVVGAVGIIGGAAYYPVWAAAHAGFEVEGRAVKMRDLAPVSSNRRLVYSVAWDAGAEPRPAPTGRLNHRFDSAGAKTIHIEVSDPMWGTSWRTNHEVNVP